MAMHVVLSTKFDGAWLPRSQEAKKYLEELGCTCYNPNVDNLKKYNDIKKEADDAWLLTFVDEVQRAHDTGGFVLQLQQGLEQQTTHMQEAEERISLWRGVPRIAMWAYEKGLTQEAWRRILRRAIKTAREQWESGDIQDEVVVVQVTYDGDMKDGLKHGYGAESFPNGRYYEGQYYENKKHGNGVMYYADGTTYEGEWCEGWMHGKGVMYYPEDYDETYPDGYSYEGPFVWGQMHGQGVYKYPDGKSEVVKHEKGVVI